MYHNKVNLQAPEMCVNVVVSSNVIGRYREISWSCCCFWWSNSKSHLDRFSILNPICGPLFSISHYVLKLFFADSCTKRITRWRQEQSSRGKSIFQVIESSFIITVYFTGFIRHTVSSSYTLKLDAENLAVLSTYNVLHWARQNIFVRDNLCLSWYV